VESDEEEEEEQTDAAPINVWTMMCGFGLYGGLPKLEIPRGDTTASEQFLLECFPF
jgi:hypothetical protein